MSYQTSSTGRTDAENAAKGIAAPGTAHYSKGPSSDFANKGNTGQLNLNNPDSIINIIVKDHETLRQLYTNFKQTAATDVHQRENLAASMIREIAIHSYLEENVLYPQYKTLLGEVDGLAAEKHSMEEHQKVKNLAYELDKDFDVKNASFTPRVDEIMRLFNHHSHEEEGDFLVQLQSKASPERLVELGKQFESKRKLAPTRPHPSTGASTVAGIMAKPVDAVRDAASGRAEMAQRAANKE